MAVYAPPPIPPFPAAQGKIANPDGTPTREYVTFLSQLRAWIEAANAMRSLTVAELPAAAANTGARFVVTNANATTFMSIVAAGGANKVPVFSDGSNYRIG